MADDPGILVETLRTRLLRGLQAASIRGGDRLPSARVLSREFGVDHRLVLAAYRVLADEGLVQLRPRGGIYVAARPGEVQGSPNIPESWLAQLLAEGLAREIQATDLHELLRRSTETLRLRAVVIAATADQGYSIARELREDFGLEADAVLADEVRAASRTPLPVLRADLVVTITDHAEWVREYAASLRKEACVIKVRPDLTSGEFVMLLRRPVYAVVASRDFGETLRNFFKDAKGVENLHLMILGEDDLSTIPVGAPTYVTQRARAQLGDVVVPGHMLPPARTICSESAREIFTFIVRENARAMRRAVP